MEYTIDELLDGALDESLDNDVATAVDEMPVLPDELDTLVYGDIEDMTSATRTEITDDAAEDGEVDGTGETDGTDETDATDEPDETDENDEPDEGEEP